MSKTRSFGLQWRLAAIYVASGAGSAAAALISYYTAMQAGWESWPAAATGFCAGLAIGFACAVAGSLITRSVKLRLWDAGSMAGRLARGDYSARLQQGRDDEVGWLEEQLNLMAKQLEEAISSLQVLAEQNRQLGEEAGRGAALEERMRLARDLHDTVNQQLFVLSMRTAAIKNKLHKENSGQNAAELVKEAEAVEELARLAHSQIRELILQIRPIALEKEGLADTLSEYYRRASESEPWELSLDIDQTARVSGPVGEGLFRIAQEALNNIVKHAGASMVKVGLQENHGSISLSVEDDGCGFELKAPRKPSSIGLRGIKERVKALNGEILIESAPGSGTKIIALIPCASERSKQT